ncbi:MAG: hypothetical protein ACFB0G_16850 [Leptolyngbyaceae cyanobacterium]
MRPEESRDLRAFLDSSDIQHREFVEEYYSLAKLPELSAAQATRLQQILRMAEVDDTLCFLMNEIDEITFQELGFYDADEQPYFDNETARIREHILSENDRQILMSFSTTGQREQVRHLGSSYRYPRVEMLYDSTQSVRSALDRQLFLGNLPSLYRYNTLHVSSTELTRTQHNTSQIGRFLQNFFVEESVSWFTLAALVWMICIIII